MFIKLASSICPLKMTMEVTRCNFCNVRLVGQRKSCLRKYSFTVDWFQKSWSYLGQGTANGSIFPYTSHSKVELLIGFLAPNCNHSVFYCRGNVSDILHCEAEQEGEAIVGADFNTRHLDSCVFGCKVVGPSGQKRGLFQTPYTSCVNDWGGDGDWLMLLLLLGTMTLQVVD